MYNKYYRLNESRWTLPKENEYFKYPDYGYDENDYNYIKEIRNLKEGWDKKIIEILEDFYYVNNKLKHIITDCVELKNTYYRYIDFSYLTEEEIIYIKRRQEQDRFYGRDWKYYYNENEDKTYLVREVIRKHPKLNPSDILFFGIYDYDLQLLSKLPCAIKMYVFSYSPLNFLFLIRKEIYYNGKIF